MKVLVSSDCNGRLSTLLEKVTQLHNKSHFDCFFLVGSVFPFQSAIHMPSILSNELKVSLPTFFIDSSEMNGVFSSLHPEGFQVAPNIQYLGSFGIKKIQSLTVAYLSGVEMPNSVLYQSGDKEFIYEGKYYNDDIINQLIKASQRYQQIDVLLTNDWAQEYESSGATKTSKLISRLVYRLSPRYHFAAGGSQFTRLDPFQSAKGHPTHFINVAPITNQTPTGKYLFGITISKESQKVQMGPNLFLKQSEGVTNQNDWTTQDKHKQAKNMVTQSQQRNQSKQQKPQTIDKNTHLYFENFSEDTHNNQITEFLQRWGEISTIQIFDPRKHRKAGLVKFREIESTQICLKDSGKYSMYNQRIRFQISHAGGRTRDDQCWFCIGTAKFDDRLLVYKGDHCYISMDKGPIVKDHLQLVPFTHQNDYAKLPWEQTSQIKNVKKLLQHYYSESNYLLISYSKKVNLSSNINHWVEHFLPVNQEEKIMVEKFLEINTRDRLGFRQLDLKKEGDSRNKYHALITIGSTSFIKELDRKDRRDILREIACILLDNVPAINWKESELSSEVLKIQKTRLQQQINLIINN